MMPSTSKKQHNFMAAVANNPSFAKKAGVPQSVGKDFTDADKGKKFGKGSSTRADVQGINQPKTNHGAMAFFKRGGTMATKKMNEGFMAMIAKKKAGAEAPSKMGKPVMKKGMDTAKDGMKMAKGGGIESKGKTKGKMITMKSGGKAC
jgi:hypothetical protein